MTGAESEAKADGVTRKDPAPTIMPRFPAGVTVLIVVAGSLALGGVTSFAQGFLPDALRPLANSASGWTAVTAVLVWAMRHRTVLSALLGLMGFVSLVLGYTLISELRGFSYNPTFWGVVGVVAGPFVGVAAAWLHRKDWRAALGAGLLAGIALGECAYGLAWIADTTGWFYWALAGAAGLALLVVTLVRRISRWGAAALALGETVVVAGAFLVVYSGI